MMRSLVILAMLLASAMFGTRAVGQCYRPYASSRVVNTYHAPSYYTPSYSYTPTYYQKEYVPYVLEVQVYKDRYYSLSDLYRDRLYLEAFDLMRDMRARLDSGGGQQPLPPVTPPQPQTAPPVPPRTAPPPPRGVPNPQMPREEASVNLGKTVSSVKTILQTNCASCHNQGNEKLDLSDVDKVPVSKRWSAFGIAAAGDMPPPPKELRAKGREEELKRWKQEHALKEEDLQAVYDHWVRAGK